MVNIVDVPDLTVYLSLASPNVLRINRIYQAESDCLLSKPQLLETPGQWRRQIAEKVTHIKGRLLYQAVILYNYVPFPNGNFS